MQESTHSNHLVAVGKQGDGNTSRTNHGKGMHGNLKMPKVMCHHTHYTAFMTSAESGQHAVPRR